MVETKVFNVNSQPKKIKPRKNNPQVIKKIIVSIGITISSGVLIILSITIERPVTPPVTKSKGTTKIAQPNANINVPTTTKPKFLSCKKMFALSSLIFSSMQFLSNKIP